MFEQKNTPRTITIERQESVLSTNAVLRNTYMLLAMTLVFSAAMAFVAMATKASLPTGIGGGLLFLGGSFGLLFLTQALRNSAWGILSVFAFTGFMGYFLGPLLSLYLASFSNGGAIIMNALGTTGLVFFGLSAYVLTTRKDFSFMTGFLTAGAIALMVAVVLGLFFQSSTFQLVLSTLFVLFTSAMILWQTSAIVNGGERNYISATIMLYLQIYNLFTSLLQLFAVFSGNND